MQSPASPQSYVIWESVHRVAAVKVGILNVESKALTFQGKDGSLRFPPNCMPLFHGWCLW